MAAASHPKTRYKTAPIGKAPFTKTSQGGAAHTVRIIAGQWRRRTLTVLDKPGLRPTPDRVRETLFNWLGQDLRGWRCLDAFAGTGALGLEAASRGAQQVLSIEQDAQSVALLRQSVLAWKANTVQVTQGDALVLMAKCPAQSFDVVFLDPPFAVQDPAQVLHAAVRLVPIHGFVYWEAPEPWPQEQWHAYGLTLQRSLRAGAVHAHLLRRVG